MKVEVVPIKRYTCDLCGQSYDTEKECLECEKFHKTGLRTSRFIYAPKRWGISDGLPEVVIFEYDDGGEVRKVSYVRDPIQLRSQLRSLKR